MKRQMKQLIFLCIVIIYALSVFINPYMYINLLHPSEKVNLMVFNTKYSQKSMPVLIADLIYCVFNNGEAGTNTYFLQEMEEEHHNIAVVEKQIVSGGNENYNKISVTNLTKKEINIEKLMEKYTLISQRKKFKILILHSHGTEAYSESEGGRSTDLNENVVAVGTHLEKELENLGFDVLHDVKMHDDSDYNKSYTNSLGTANWYLNTYDDIGIIIDLHRDAIESESGERIKLTYDANGEKAAQLMMVVGSNGGGLKHDNYFENLKFAIALQQTGQEKFEGLFRPVNFRNERFNQHIHSNYIILEVGTHGNSLKEAKKSVELFAKVLDEAVK